MMKTTCSCLVLLVAIASVLPTSAFGSQTTTVEPDSPSFKRPNDLRHPLPKPGFIQPETIYAPGWVVTLLPSGYEAFDASITGVVVLEKDYRYYRWIAGGMELLGKGVGVDRPIVNSSGYIAYYDGTQSLAIAKLWKPQRPSFYFSYPSPTYTYKWQAWDNLGIVPGQIHWTIVQTGVAGSLWVLQFDDKNQIWAGLNTGPDTDFLAKITDTGRAAPLQDEVQNPQISRGGYYYYYSATGLVIDGSPVENFSLRRFSRNGIAIAWGTYFSDPFRLRLPNGTIEEILIPNVYTHSVWVDDQDRLNGTRYDEATSSEVQCLFLKKKDSDGNVITPVEYEAFEYLPLILSDGWQTDHMVAPGTTSPQIGIATKAGQSRYFLAMRQLLQVDADRSGTIDDADGASPDKPFRFWINDDDDWSDTEGDDIPGQIESCSGKYIGGEADYSTTGEGIGNVNGTRDLVDYFPVYLDLKQLLNALPPTTTTGGSPGVRYKLKQADSAVNFVYTNLTRATAFDYLRNPQPDGYGPSFVQPAQSATKYHVTADGVSLFNSVAGSSAFLDAIQNRDGGVILIEGRKATDKPLVLSIEKDGSVLAEVKLELKISSVEDMFRHKNIRAAVSGMSGGPEDRLGPPANFPDDPANNKAFVFVHGYNVNSEQSRGWEAEIFKRMYWAGSKARFYGVDWAGDRDQMDLTAIGAGKKTPNFHRCVNDAFASAQAFAQFIGSAEFSSREVTVAAHSLGNLVVASAEHDYPEIIQSKIKNFFMVNAALTIEAVMDKTSAPAGQNITMVPIAWRNYPERLYASEWHKLSWPNSDSRNLLTWRGRVANHTSQRINFYSNVANGLGDQVMRTPPANGDEAWWLQLQQGWGAFLGEEQSGLYSFCLQERLKGRLSNLVNVGSTNGGWQFTPNNWQKEEWFGDPPIKTATILPSSEVTETTVPSMQLMDKPFFSPYANMIGNGGSVYCSWSDRGNLLLSEAIPARTLAAGGNTINSIESIDMQSQFQNGWPSRPERETQAWLHSDLRDVAYLYVYPLFENWVLRGGLN